MKYIRTEKRIYPIEEYKAIYDEHLKQDICFDRVEKKIAEADTIEELVDAIVGIYNGEYQFLRSFPYKCSNYWDIVYGAVWTNKGLIYVVKMNDKGELKLI